MTSEKAAGHLDEKQRDQPTTYQVRKKNESGSIIEVTVTSERYAGKSAVIAQISPASAYHNLGEE